MKKTPNEELKEIMAGLGMDTRPDPKLNRDADQIADEIGVSRRTIIGWLSPPHWKSHRNMPMGYLELLKIKLGELA